MFSKAEKIQRNFLSKSVSKAEGLLYAVPDHWLLYQALILFLSYKYSTGMLILGIPLFDYIFRNRCSRKLVVMRIILIAHSQSNKRSLILYVKYLH